jgi:hypothetical protein
MNFGAIFGLIILPIGIILTALILSIILKEEGE